MKTWLVLLFCIASLSAFSQARRLNVMVPISDVFIPDGFDSNDEVDIVIEGVLPTLCHFNPKVAIQEQRGNTIVISATADLLQAQCLKTFTPFVKTLKVSGLKAGNYSLRFISPSGAAPGVKVWSKAVALTIKPPKKFYQDESIYANVHSIYSIDKNTIGLRGIHSSNCFRLEQIETLLVKSNVLVIIPIMKKVQGIDCLPPNSVPFEYKIDLRDQNIKNKTLIHVRSISGQSLNIIHQL